MKKIKLKKLPSKSSKKSTKVKKEKSQKSLWKTILSFALVCAIALISLFLAFALYIVITSPDFEKSALYQKEPTILYDVNGLEFARIGTKDSTIVTYDELPEVLIDALIATEDSRFFQHNGLDLVRFLKASVLQVLGQDDAGGASTLSMQVVKNTYTQKGKSEENMIQSLTRKFRDIYMSVFKLEANYTKEEIIEFYLNSQWFANTGNINVGGLWGIERASEWYFGKSSKDLNLAEASLMAGMFQNTSWYNPYRNPEGCRTRQKTVLNLMVKHGYITEEQRDAVLSIPISSMFINHEIDLEVESNQAFIDHLLNEVQEKLNINPTETSLKIYTTFDPKIQSVLEQVENGDIYKFPNDVVEEGIAVTSTKDGSIVALSGGRNYQAKGDNLATEINKQPGSTAKPLFDYAMYIEHISQSTYDMFLDEKTTYTNGASISNYDNKFDGLITMRYALDDSRNIPALLAFKAVYKLDPDIIKDFVHSVGINYGSELYESASIGGFNGMSPLEMSAAYGAFARGGYYIEPYSYTKVINTETGDEINYSYTKKQVMEESTAYMITDILLDAYGGKAPSGTQVAGKTGTTNLDSATKKKYGLKNSGALMDVWLVSYSPSYSIGLWYGYKKIYDNAHENGYYLTSNTGGTARRQIMNGLSTKIHKKGESFKRPKTVTTVNVEKETFPAQLCSEFTPKEMCVEELFVRGTEPTEVSKRYSKLENATNGKASFNGSTITLTWDSVNIPDAINPNYLTEHFNEYYGEYATKYYENRITYNNTYLGNIGYQIYLKNADGTEIYLGYTNSPTFTYTTTTGNYTFIVKTAYSIFKDNMSSGLSITAQANVQTPIEDIVGGNANTNNSNDQSSNTNLN